MPRHAVAVRARPIRAEQTRPTGQTHVALCRVPVSRGDLGIEVARIGKRLEIMDPQGKR